MVDADWLLRDVIVDTGALLRVTIVDTGGLPSGAIVCTVGLLWDVIGGISKLLKGMDVGVGLPPRDVEGLMRDATVETG